jgi:hypothetical protein
MPPWVQPQKAIRPMWSRDVVILLGAGACSDASITANVLGIFMIGGYTNAHPGPSNVKTGEVDFDLGKARQVGRYVRPRLMQIDRL